MMKIGRILPLGLLLSAAVAAAAPVRIVSFSTVLSEVAREVGGDAVEVDAVLKPGVDPHDYRPTPSDFKNAAAAQLVLVSGNGMEHYLDQLQSNEEGGKSRMVAVGAMLPTLKLEEHGDDEHGHHHGGGEADPHWWHSVPNVMQAAGIVRDALIEIDPAQKALFAKNAERYIARLDSLNKWIKRRVAELPRDSRNLVTSHDAFQYFAEEYGFEVDPIEGINHEQEPSARGVDSLINTIRKDRVKAIFLEDTLNPKVSKELTRETGVAIGGTLTADGLGEGESSSYEGMMKHNVSTIVDALK